MSRCIIFLDVDGVLNSLRSTLAFGGCGKPEQLDQVAIGLLRRLVRELQADGWSPGVVMSSTWRLHLPDISWWTGFLGVSVVGCTPELGHATARRGHECLEWLVRNAPDAPFVCIDDDADFLPDQVLVQTKFEDGLQIGHIDAAFQAITGKPMPGLPRIFAPKVLDDGDEAAHTGREGVEP